MKIALCISGGLRNFKDTFYSFDEMLLKKHDVDIFFYGVENKEKYEQNIIDITTLYNPKKYVINTLSYYDSIPCKHLSATPYYAFYNILQCNALKTQYEKEHNFIYDAVIRCRTDYFWFRPITTEEIELSQQYVLTPAEWSFKGVNSFAVCDMFALGSSALMDRYSEIFINIDDYCKEISFHPESIVGYHILKKNIPHKEISRHVIYEYPCARVERYIEPYKFIKYFPVPDIANEDDFLRIISNKRRDF